METMDTKLDNALSRLRRFCHPTDGKPMSIAPAIGEGSPKFWIPDSDPMSAYSLRRQLEYAINDASAAEDVWEDLIKKVSQSEKLSVLECAAFHKTIFFRAGLQCIRACQYNTAVEYAKRLFALNTAQAHLLVFFVYGNQGEFKAAIDEALKAFDKLFDIALDEEGFSLACHAASEVGYMLQTMTEHQPQLDLLDSFDSRSIPGTVIQAAEWATEAFLCHKMLFPNAITLNQFHETRAFNATLRLSFIYFGHDIPWRSTDRSLQRLIAVVGQLLWNSPKNCFNM